MTLNMTQLSPTVAVTNIDVNYLAEGQSSDQGLAKCPETLVFFKKKGAFSDFHRFIYLFHLRRLLWLVK